MIKLLRLYDYYGISETIEIAKGKYEIPLTIKRALEQKKRDGRRKENN